MCTMVLSCTCVWINREVFTIFQLKSSSTNYMSGNGISSPEEIARYQEIGYTHIIYEGQSRFLYIDDEDERARFKKLVGLPHYEWFQEGTGNKNWVLYNPTQFKPDRNWKGKKILKFDKDAYKGGRFEIPINASSCCGMFSWVTLPEDFRLDKLFDTSNVVDMNLMFAGSILPGTFQVGEKFDTSKVKDMRYMFYECVLPDNFVFPENFDTRSAEKMDFMFSECKFPGNIVLPDSFDTTNVKSMDHMFYETIFNGHFEFGNNFKIEPEVNKTMIFSDCIIDSELLSYEYSEDFEYVRNLLKSK